MATDYAEKERAFIAGLQSETGKDLAGWMAAIEGSKLESRNDIIDWLRLQGFAFARASWLERIHHNGGRLIYAGDVSSAGAGDRPAAEPPAPEPRGAPQRKPTDAPNAVGGDVAQMLLSAKGLRPLADLMLKEIARAVPAAAYEARAPFILVSGPKPFAALLPGAKQLKLYADFGAHGSSVDVRRTEPSIKTPGPFPHVLAIDDARRLGPAFASLVASAYATAHV